VKGREVKWEGDRQRMNVREREKSKSKAKVKGLLDLSSSESRHLIAAVPHSQNVSHNLIYFTQCTLCDTQIYQIVRHCVTHKYILCVTHIYIVCHTNIYCVSHNISDNLCVTQCSFLRERKRERERRESEVGWWGGSGRVRGREVKREGDDRE